MDMDEIIQDQNPLGLTSWIPAKALNALNITTEGGLTPQLTPKHLLFILLLLLLGTGALLMHYSVGLRIPPTHKVGTDSGSSSSWPSS